MALKMEKNRRWAQNPDYFAKVSGKLYYYIYYNIFYRAYI